MEPLTCSLTVPFKNKQFKQKKGKNKRKERRNGTPTEESGQGRQILAGRICLDASIAKDDFRQILVKHQKIINMTLGNQSWDTFRLNLNDFSSENLYSIL